MFATLFVSPTARLLYCRVHQRAWVESLDRWMTFREPTLYGSPVTEAVCDICTASRHDVGFGDGRSGGQGESSGCAETPPVPVRGARWVE
jgi:hypothetical protein